MIKLSYRDSFAIDITDPTSHKLHKDLYALRMIEKYLEDHPELPGVSDLASIPELSGLRDKPLVKQVNKQVLKGQPWTIEVINKVIDSLEQYEGSDDNKNIGQQNLRSQLQSDDQFNNIPRRVVYFGFDIIPGMSEDAKRFIEREGPSLKHIADENIGDKGKNIGWVAWKDISSVVGYPAVLIEQIQGDYRNFFKRMKHFETVGQNRDATYAQRMYGRAATIHLERYNREYGPETIQNIEKEFNTMMKDYEAKILSKFLMMVKGTTVYMTGKDKIMEIIEYKPNEQTIMPDLLYDTLPKSFGFREAPELPGYLKLERASLSQRISHV